MPGNRWGEEYAGRQKDSIVGFMICFKKEHDYWPTVRDIQEYMGFRSSNTAWRWLQRLEQEGRVISAGRRGYMVPGGTWRLKND